MPDPRRAVPVGPAAPELRAAAASILAIPVIAFVIAESLVRRVGRPKILLAVLLIGTYAAAPAWTALAASPATASRSVSADGSLPVTTSAPTPVPTPAPTDPPAVAALPPATTPKPTIAPTATQEAPSVIRFRPRDGWTAVSRFAALSVRFSQPMEHASTQQAFHITVGGKRVTGEVRWAEADTVLIMDPARPLEYGTLVKLTVHAGARSAQGRVLTAGRSVEFTVQSQPARPPRPATSAPGSTAHKTPTTAAWRWPLFGRITQRFGESKTRYGFHQGIDIDGQLGDRVRAARSGRVTLAGTGDACGGLQVHVDHGDGVESWYRHLSRLDVERGSVVAAGTVVGRVGDTGCSLGSHLHFAIRRNGTFVDPLRYLPRR